MAFLSWRSLSVSLAIATIAVFAAASSRAAEDPPDRVAYQYYRALAEGGSADAQMAVGDMHRYGEGVPADLIEAYAWYYLAAQQGLEEAIRPMNDTFHALPEAQWPLAKRLAESYEKRFIPKAK